MPFLRKTWLQIRVFLDGLPHDTKFLIIALVVILGLSGLLIVRWAGAPDMVPLHQVAVERQAVVMQRLKSNGIKAGINGGGMIVVPQDKQSEALAILAQFNLLSADTSEAFDKMTEAQSPWMIYLPPR